MMKRRGLQILMILVLICTLGISACKKDVGTPEDNAVTEPEEEERIRQVINDGGIQAKGIHRVYLYQ